MAHQDDMQAQPDRGLLVRLQAGDVMPMSVDGCEESPDSVPLKGYRQEAPTRETALK